MKLSANDIVLKLLGLLLLTAAMLKGYQLITEPVANTDLWSNRIFLIFTVEFELAMGIWLISGLFRKMAWLATIACFSVFCCVTLYKALSGYGSCGCFGKIHVNPWVTLFVIDLPAVLLLAVFRPKDFNVRNITRPVELLKPLPSLPFLVGICLIGIATVVITVPALGLNEPATVTSSYEVLEPAEWIGKELPILEHIDIASQIKTGNWLLLLYHHDCPDCQIAVGELEKIARDLKGNEEFLRIAFIEVPPYGHASISEDTLWTFGKLDKSKEWFVTTPVCLLVKDSAVQQSYEGKVPNFDQMINYLANRNAVSCY